MRDVESMPEFEIDGWRIQPRRNRVVGPGGVECTLEPKVMEVLVCLARHRGEVVSRDVLLDEVWTGVHVGEKVLTRAVSEIRRAFDDDPRRPRVVETIIKRGYRLLPDVRPVAPQAEAAPASRAPGASGTRGRGTESGGGAGETTGRTVRWGIAALMLILGAWLLAAAVSDEGSDPAEPVVRVPLTSFPGWEYDPAVSPDGSRVAYVWEGDPRRAWEIYVQQTGAGRPVRVTREGGTDGSPTWSPDGRRLAYYRYRPDTGVCELYERAVLGGSERFLGRCAARYPDLSWSPRGDLLALHERIGSEGAPFSIVLLDLESGSRRPLSRPPAEAWGDHHAAFSPDGDRVAFVRTLSEGLQDVYVVDVATGTQTRLTSDATNVRGVTWRADGASVLFASRRGGEFELWQVDAGGAGTAPERVEAGHGVSNPDARAGVLVVEEWTSDANIWRLDLAAGGPGDDTNDVGSDAYAESGNASPLIDSTRWDLNPAFAPGGEYVAFVSDRSGAHEVWLADADGSDPARLTRFGGPYVSTPRFAPDGDRVVFEARPHGQADLYVVDVRGGEPERLTEHPADDLWGVFGPDGDDVFFASARSGSWQLWRLERDGVPSRITRDGGTAPQLAPDGRHLLYTRIGEKGLWRVPLDGGAEELVYEGIETGRPGSWTVGAGGLFHVRSGIAPGDPDEILFHDPAGGRTATVFSTAGLTSRDASLALSPDGRWLLFGRTDRVTADLSLLRRGPPGD